MTVIRALSAVRERGEMSPHKHAELLSPHVREVAVASFEPRYSKWRLARFSST
jgi:hypothetical protein